MRHIKTPVKCAGLGFGRANLFDADNDTVLIGLEEEWCKELAVALNAHDLLVDALKQAADELDSIIDQKGHTGLTRDIRDAAYALLAQIKEER